jgi:hypothetical protein
MAQCSLCSAANKKLFKGSYMAHLVYVCNKCVFNQNIELETANV